MNVMTDMPVRMSLLSEAGQKGLVTKNHFESEIIFDKETEFEFLDFEVGTDPDSRRKYLHVITRVVE
jgi:hypothetical protein